MRPAPNWKTPADSVDGVWKQDLLRWLGQELSYPILVETGTCEGSTPFAVHGDFERIYTTELHPGLHEVSRRRLEMFKNVHLYKMSSPDFLLMLRSFLPYDSRIVFWLDAHTSGPHTADAGDVLPDELDIIVRNWPDAVVVVDDMPSERFAYVDPLMISRIDSILAMWKREYRTGEVFLYRPGITIPEFERVS